MHASEEQEEEGQEEQEEEGEDEEQEEQQRRSRGHFSYDHLAVAPVAGGVAVMREIPSCN